MFKREFSGCRRPQVHVGKRLCGSGRPPAGLAAAQPAAEASLRARGGANRRKRVRAAHGAGRAGSLACPSLRPCRQLRARPAKGSPRQAARRERTSGAARARRAGGGNNASSARQQPAPVRVATAHAGLRRTRTATQRVSRPRSCSTRPPPAAPRAAAADTAALARPRLHDERPVALRPARAPCLRMRAARRCCARRSGAAWTQRGQQGPRWRRLCRLRRSVRRRASSAACGPTWTLSARSADCTSRARRMRSPGSARQAAETQRPKRLRRGAARCASHALAPRTPPALAGAREQSAAGGAANGRLRLALRTWAGALTRPSPSRLRSAAVRIQRALRLFSERKRFDRSRAAATKARRRVRPARSAPSR